MVIICYGKVCKVYQSLLQMLFTHPVTWDLPPWFSKWDCQSWDFASFFSIFFHETWHLLPPGEDESEAECSQEENEVEEEDEIEGEQNGMVIPQGVVPMHHEDGAMDDGHFSCCSSDGLQDMEDEDADDPAVVEEPNEGPASSSGADGHPDPGLAASASHGGRIKAYHTSAEWIELEEIEQMEGIHLLRVPPIIGCGVNRHPSNSYWSCRFPGHPAKTASWSNGIASPKACLVLCLRHVLKLYLSSGPSDQSSYQKQLADLQRIGA